MADPAPYLAAVVQFGTDAFLRGDDDSGHIASNLRHMLSWIRFLCEETARPPKLIVFPILPLVESSIRPVPANRTRLRLVDDLDPVLEPLVAACAKYSCYLALSGLERHPALPKDTMHTGFVLNENGVVLRQPKFQPHDAGEVPHIRALFQRYVDALGYDALNTVVETPLGRLGCIVDRDLLIPEMGRARAQKFADVLVHPSLAWPGEVARSRDVAYDAPTVLSGYNSQHAVAPFQAMRQTFAYQNCLYLLTANHAFERWTDDGQEFVHEGLGGSMIAGPNGDVLALCQSSGEGVAFATIDVAAARAARNENGAVTLPVWDLYRHTYQPMDTPVP